MDQLDNSQPHGVGARARPVRNLLLFDAVCRLYGLAWHRSATHLDRTDVHLGRHLLPQSAAFIYRSHPAHVARRGHRYASVAHPASHAQGGVRTVDVDLPLGVARMELCASRLLLLAFRRFLVGRDAKGRGRSQTDRARRRGRFSHRKRRAAPTMGGLGTISSTQKEARGETSSRVGTPVRIRFPQRQRFGWRSGSQGSWHASVKTGQRLVQRFGDGERL